MVLSGADGDVADDGKLSALKNSASASLLYSLLQEKGSQVSQPALRSAARA
jgi:hypothetical protein